MGKQLLDSLTAIAVAVVGIAIVAVLVSGSSQTANVIKSAGGAFGGVLKAAVSPVSGGGISGLGNSLFSGGSGASEFTPSL